MASDTFLPSKLLLHCCCAPCSGGVIEDLLAQKVDLTLYFYNPNIAPEGEYLKRKQELIRFAAGRSVPMADDDYEPDVWQARIAGLEKEPEGGVRCAHCFMMRLEKTALYAHTNNFSVFATTMGISRWKNMENVNACGRAAATRYQGLTFWEKNWRKNGGNDAMRAVIAQETFYQQEYCGCPYSLRDANARRAAQGKPHINL